MSKNIVISGIKETNDEDCVKTAADFFKDKLQTDNIQMEVAHRIGVGANRPIVVWLVNTKQKGKIFSKVSKLKGVKNEDRKPYRVDSQLPEELSEHKKQMAMHFKDSKQRNPASQQNISMQKGMLLVDNQPYHKVIQPPTPEEMIYAPDYLKKKADEIVLHESKEIIERGSRFIAYIAEVESYDEIRAAYYKMKRIHGKARHIVCAYRLTECCGPLNQDGIDDAEFGASRNLLHYLKVHHMQNTVIFAVRYYGGAKLGPLRFQIIMDVAKDAHQQMINTSFESLTEAPEQHTQP